MPIMKRSELPWGEARPGVRWQFIAGKAASDSADPIEPGLTMFYEVFEPGAGVPRHSHGCDEILTVLEGQAELQLGDERCLVEPGVSVHVPAGTRHGFRNTGAGCLQVQCVLSASAMRADWVES